MHSQILDTNFNNPASFLPTLCYVFIMLYHLFVKDKRRNIEESKKGINHKKQTWVWNDSGDYIFVTLA